MVAKNDCLHHKARLEIHEPMHEEDSNYLSALDVKPSQRMLLDLVQHCRNLMKYCDAWH